MRISVTFTKAWPILLLASSLTATAFAAEQQLDITPAGGDYAGRTNLPGNRTAQPESGAASFAFTRLDANGNESLSRSEASEWKPLADHFDQVDRNHDLQITPAEFNAFEVERMRAQQKPRLSQAQAEQQRDGGAGATPGDGADGAKPAQKNN